VALNKPFGLSHAKVAQFFGQCLGHVLRRVRELAARASRGAVHYPRRRLASFTEAIHLRNRHLRGG
jgi:hypothetical protein